MRQRTLLSRAAEAVFWMARYVERAENIARMIDVNLNLSLDTSKASAEQWSPLFQVADDEAEFLKRYDFATPANVMRFLTFDRTYPNSITSCLWAARENARSIRDIISSEMYEHLNKAFLMVRHSSPDRVLARPSEFYKEVRTASHLFEGLSYATMSHSEPWHFAMVGRMLERADQTTRILDVKYFVLLPGPEFVGSPVDDIQWAAVLKSVSGFEMYRKEYGSISPAQIVEFLIRNREFPRAISYCLDKARSSLYTVTGTPIGAYKYESERLLSKLRSNVMYADTTDVVIRGLHEYLDGLQVDLSQIGWAIHKDFFEFPDLVTQSVQTQG